MGWGYPIAIPQGLGQQVPRVRKNIACGPEHTNE
jgi:hypothetical protein